MCLSQRGLSVHPCGAVYNIFWSNCAYTLVGRDALAHGGNSAVRRNFVIEFARAQVVDECVEVGWGYTKPVAIIDLRMPSVRPLAPRRQRCKLIIATDFV